MREFKKLDRVPSSDMEIKILIAPIAEAKREYSDIVMENNREAIRAGMERTKTELKRQGLGKGKNSNLMFYLNGSLKLVSPELDFEEFSREVSDRIKEDTFEASGQTIDRMSGDVMDNIRESYEAGYGIDKAAVNLQDVFDDMEDWELKRIARTEINGAQNQGAEATMIELGVVYDKWKTAGDARVRGNKPEDTADHRYMEGQISYVLGNFSNGLSRPGDRSGPIKEWIQCRCDLVPFLMPEGYTAPSGTFFYESDLVAIEVPEPGVRPKPGERPKREEFKPERIREGHEIFQLKEENKINRIQEYYREIGEEISEGRAEEILKAIEDFTGDYFSEIREIQRIGDIEFGELYSKIYGKDKIMKIFDAADDLDEYLRVAPKYPEETIYRGLKIKPEIAERIFKKGKIFTDKSISSFTSSSREAESYGNVILHTQNKSGISLEYATLYPGEGEVLIPRDTRYIIKNIIREKTKTPGQELYKVFMEEI